MKKILSLIIILTLGVLVYFLFIQSPEQNQGKKAPDFQAELINGDTFTLSDLKGDYVLLDFWGSWCPPCRRDNPNLVKLYNEFHGEEFKNADNFHVVTIALEKNDRTWQKAAEKDGFAWKHQIVETTKVVIMSNLAQKYGVKDLPSKFLIDPNGRVIGVNQPYSEIKAFLQSQL